MNIPDKVRIGSMDYKIELMDNPIINKDSQRCYGHIDWDSHVIEIDKTLQDIQGQQETFLHELVHGIIHEHHIKIDDEEEEIFVNDMALGLHQVIRDNPEIFKVN